MQGHSRLTALQISLGYVTKGIQNSQIEEYRTGVGSL